uniref:SMP domain-containing protein n=1 Tax=Oryza glaberrima TaxID=4538 RepID=I1QHN4_ORYGL
MSELHEQRQRPTHAARIGGEGQQPGAAFIDAVRAQSIHGSAAAAAEAAGERLFNGDLLQEANGSKYQQQKLGDVPSSQPHHLNQQVTPALTACRSTTSRRLRRGASSARPPLLLLLRRRLRAIPNVIPSEHGRAADHAGFLDTVDPLL